MSVSFNPINHRNHPVQLNFWDDVGKVFGYTPNPTVASVKPKGATGPQSIPILGCPIKTDTIKTDTSDCACQLKSNIMIQELAGSRQKVQDYAYSEIKASGNCDNLAVLKKYPEIEEKLLNLPARSNTWQSLTNIIPKIKFIRDKLLDGLGEANVGLGKCYGKRNIDTNDTINQICYGIQDNFQSRICNKESGCCMTLLSKACAN